MLLFVGYDPGSKNHILPIYNKAIEQGKRTQFLDLSVRTDLIDDLSAGEFIKELQPSALIGGTSTHQQEKALFSSCNRLGIPTVAVVDIAAAGKFGSTINNYANLFLVNSLGCSLELSNLMVDPSKIIVAGSTYLEELSQTRFNYETRSIKDYYGVSPSTTLVPFFCRPNVSSTISAIFSLGKTISAMDLRTLLVIVRPHPRCEDRQLLVSACQQLGNIRYDSGEDIPTPELLSKVRISLSMGSTTSLESIVMGVPSAFYLMGWDSSSYNSMFKNIPSVPRIRHRSEFKQFVNLTLAHQTNRRNGSENANIENHVGALRRSWDAISDLIYR